MDVIKKIKRLFGKSTEELDYLIPENYYSKDLKITNKTVVKVEPYCLFQRGKLYTGYSISKLGDSIFNKSHVSIKKSLKPKVSQDLLDFLINEYESMIKGIEHIASLGAKNIHVRPSHEFIKEWLTKHLDNWMKCRGLKKSKFKNLHNRLINVIRSNKLTLRIIKKKKAIHATFNVFMMVEFPKVFYRNTSSHKPPFDAPYGEVKHIEPYWNRKFYQSTNLTN